MFMLLQRVDILGLGLFHQAHWEIRLGLNVIIGESGAGKSMLYQILHFGMGFGTLNANMLSPGKTSGSVRLCFYLDETSDIAGLVVEAGDVIVQRTLDTQGRTKASLNGHTISITELKTFSEKHLFLSKQHAHLALAKSEYILSILDASLDNHLLLETKTAWHTLDACHKAIQERQADILSDTRLAELTTKIEALEGLFHTHGDETYTIIDQTARGLEKDMKRLITLDQCISAMNQSDIERLALLCYDLVSVDGQKAIDHFIDAYHSFQAALGDPQSELSHIAGDMSSYDETLGRFHSLSKKFHTTPEQLHLLYGEISQALSKHHETVLRSSEDNKKLLSLTEAYERSALKLREAREKVSARLIGMINQHLPEIGIPQTQLKLVIESKPPSEMGIDHAKILMGPIDGETMQPLAQRASGGEMSRLYLLLNSVSHHEGCYLFDEVDTGISGQTAMMVGKYLYSLARKVPVVVISHTPQVAAFADHLWRLEKTFQDSIPQTTLHALEPEQHDSGLSRMLEGGEKQATALTHAQSLINNAKDIILTLSQA